MAVLSKIDIRENILRNKGNILDILLKDQTRSNKRKSHNIIWATDSYTDAYGPVYGPKQPIRKEQITGPKLGKLIQPRASKSREEQSKRTKDKAEVFTPLKVVSAMNHSLEKSMFPTDTHTWLDFVCATWLEITCGEAPFIAGRYDPVLSRQTIVPVKRRVGFFDRKLQVVCKYVSEEVDWLYHAEIALKACYGYEWQGDNLLIARENILLTMNDFFAFKFKKNLAIAQLEYFAEIISWNIFQMDGIKYVIPMSCHNETKIVHGEVALFWKTSDTIEKYECEGCKFNRPRKHNGKYVKIMDWDKNKTVRFVDLL